MQMDGIDEEQSRQLIVNSQGTKGKRKTSPYPTERGEIFRRSMNIFHPFTCLIAVAVVLGFNNRSEAFPADTPNCTYSQYKESVNIFCGVYTAMFFLSAVFHCLVLLVQLKKKEIMYTECGKLVLLGDGIDMMSRIGAIFGSFYLVMLLHYDHFCLNNIDETSYKGIKYAMWSVFGGMMGGMIHYVGAMINATVNITRHQVLAENKSSQ